MTRIYKVISLDVWGNAREGFEVNDAHYTGQSIKLSENFSDVEVIKALKAIGEIRGNFQFKSFTIDGEANYTLFVEHKSGRPVVQLEFDRDATFRAPN